MIKKIGEIAKNSEWLVLVLLTVVFVGLRFSGTGLPLHQDEYKWPSIVNPEIVSDTEVPHPPLSQFIYRVGGSVVGYNTNFRFIPLFFGTVNLLLLYWLMKILYSRREAVIASVIWIFSYFSVLASLMVDTDGEIMPFFFLLALIGYFKFLNSDGNKKYWWGALLLVSCVLGFFIKVSFLLAVGAIVADFLWSKKHLLNVGKLIKYFGGLVLGVFVLGLLLYLAQYIFPFFSLAKALTYWEHFATLERGWFQTLIQCIKALLYTSPFLVLVPFLGSKNSFERIKVFVFFILFSLVFYVVLFDFSIGALDRYMQLLVLPLSVICSVIISKIFQGDDRRFREFFYLGIIVAFVLILLQSLSHYVPPLHPKSDWVNRALQFKWNFLYPFSGGSGPLGFYVSFLFMALSWIITFFAILFAKYKPEYKKLVLIFLIPLGFAYNLVFTEEYLVGYWNGNAPKLLADAVEYIKNNDEIKMVTVYNDNGGNEIQEIGKYRKRLYVDPKFDLDEKIATLNQYKEHYFVLDVPQIDPTSVYQKYFDSCIPVYKKTDRSMSATVYDCRKVPDIKL